MRYKIESFFTKNFYFYDKKSLFDFFDLNIDKYGFDYSFGKELSISHEKGFLIRRICENTFFENERYYSIDVNIYASHLYVVKDENGFVVDYKKLLNEYRQSRSIKLNVWKRKLHDRSTAKYRRKFKKSRFKQAKNSYINDYTFLILSEKEGVKVRKKRLFVSNFNFDHEELEYRKNSKSWKNFKNKKQWN